MPVNFSEFTRVQIPALLHLERLGYTFVHHSKLNYDLDSNILVDVFKEQVQRLNPSMREMEVEEKLRELIRVSDDKEGLGQEFYQKLMDESTCRLIDFDDPGNNDWRCTIELDCVNQTTKNRFRPDITCFINGLPLVHIEVKKPQNRDGMLAERERMHDRMRQVDFRRYLNIAQLMIFSNNEEYDDESRVPIQGAFYASMSKGKMFFNTFREASQSYYELLPLNDISLEREKEILHSINKSTIISLPEYKTNKNPLSPTNRIISSLLAKERILYFLKYGFAYVKLTKKNDQGEEYTELQKHVMRYPQFFASRSICAHLDRGINSGTIWHTQGSGKTALAFYAVKILTNYFSRRNTAARFYFIVDRIALMEQAMREFSARGLKVFSAQSRKELMEDFASNSTMRGTDGKPEITVVNIQKFDEQTDKLEVYYGTNIQRVFFVDEAHRGYSLGGTFLANLMNSDTKAVRIALTGTPLLREERETWKIFGNYYDKYYYDKSIADGYTLRLMREEIETDYKDKLLQIIQEQFPDDIEVKKSDITKDMIIESDNYVSTLVEYVSKDLKTFRIRQGDQSLAGMLVCENNKQARKVKQFFDQYQTTQTKPLRAELILHDEGEAETRKQITENFKDATDIDLLIVNQMLLTGFDAHRLKRLYLTRKMRDHDLLQALTRVNRPYKEMSYGYVVDFAGIKENFEEANDNYIRELNACDIDTADEPTSRPTLGDSIMASKEEIIEKLKHVGQVLFHFDTTNAENLRMQLEEEEIAPESLYELRRALEEARSLSNQIRTFGDDELRKKLKYLEEQNSSFVNLLAVVNDRIARVRQVEVLTHSEDVHEVVNTILADMQYQFKQNGKSELKFIWDDELQEKLRAVVHEFEDNFDHEEKEFKLLLESFKKYYREMGFKPISRQEVLEKMGYLDGVMSQVREINRRNNVLKHKLSNDERYVRVYKRIDEQNRQRTMEQPYIISKVEMECLTALNHIHRQVEEMLFNDQNLITNDTYFGNMVMARVSRTILEVVHNNNMPPTHHMEQFTKDCTEVKRLLVMEYTNQYQQYQFGA